ncbi:hypothetical protein BN1723_004032 [Verticillium longisporum]|uniref:Uncharacterized protein n=1 Tax=Verticillium longisporum TaxID=100787 RepID=A0A0G4MJK1_VERLO|nr:hypothetical protein BN1723_004032 [Verticillium longisporum]
MADRQTIMETNRSIRTIKNRHLAPHFSENKVKQLVELGLDQQKLESTPVDEYVDLYVSKDSKFI